MASSLDKLSCNLRIDKFLNLKKYCSGNQLGILFRKGVYPYYYVHCMKKIDEISLPPKEGFYSKLAHEGITDEDYQHAQTVWREFNIASIKGYNHLYNLSDVLLLVDVFENFRNICMNHYGFDPAWYFNALGLAWNAALKIATVQLELLSDSDMLLMIQSGIKREIATISHRHAKANNEYMGTEFDPTKDPKLSHI